MKTREIVKEIRENGGFDNFRNWNVKEIATWVRANYECSYSVSINVARLII
jgi:hypothetical protein